MKWLLHALFVVILASLVPQTVLAEMSLYVGSDWSHFTGTKSQKKALDLRYFGEKWPHWSVSFSTFGTGSDSTSIVCTELYQPWKRFYAGWGTCLKNNSHDDIVSGKFAYQIRIGWNFYEHDYRRVKRIGLEYLHFSNCASAFKSLNKHDCLVPGLPRGDKPNEAYHFMGVRVKW